MSVLYDAMKNVASDFDKNRTASGFLFGTVKGVEPLTIEIDRKLTLSEKFITVAQHLTDYTIDCEITSDSIDGFVAIHESEHVVKVKPGLQKGKVLLKNKLVSGDKVILARMEDGHQYIVIDRLPQ